MNNIQRLIDLGIMEDSFLDDSLTKQELADILCRLLDHFHPSELDG